MGLQSKIKSYKKQIEEAEEIAALNLAKFRNAHAQLSDAEERADLNEQALAKSKAKARVHLLEWCKYDAKPCSSMVMIVNILGCKRDSSVFTNMVVVNSTFSTSMFAFIASLK